MISHIVRTWHVRSDYRNSPALKVPAEKNDILPGKLRPFFHAGLKVFFNGFFH